MVVRTMYSAHADGSNFRRVGNGAWYSIWRVARLVAGWSSSPALCSHSEMSFVLVAWSTMPHAHPGNWVCSGCWLFKRSWISLLVVAEFLLVATFRSQDTVLGRERLSTDGFFAKLGMTVCRNIWIGYPNCLGVRERCDNDCLRPSWGCG